MPTDEPTNTLCADDPGQRLSYTLAVGFLPEIKIEQQKGMAFFSKLSRFVDLKNIGLQQPRWTFDGSGNYDGLKAAFGATNLSISFNRPPNAQDWHEERLRFIIGEFQKEFSPSYVVDCGAMVRTLLSVNGDAREFLAHHVMHLAPQRINSIGRPIHILGIRLMMPPFELVRDSEETGDATDATSPIAREEWEADVRMESWLADPSKLWVEIKTTWQKPMPWTNEQTGAIVDHLRVASGFVTDKIVPFLRDQSAETGT